MQTMQAPLVSLRLGGERTDARFEDRRDLALGGSGPNQPSR